MTSADSIGLEILRRRFEALAAELGAVVGKLARSNGIRENRAFSVAILDQDGGVVAIDNPLHLGLMAGGARCALDRFRYDTREGDVILLGDAHEGGSRSQDLMLIAPITVAGSTVLQIAARAEMPDLGGDVIGSVNPTAREVWAEGVPVPPVKLWREGHQVRDIQASLLMNTRFPAEVEGNLEALLAAIRLGTRRMLAMAADHGVETVLAAAGHAQDYAERRGRALLLRWGKGTATVRGGSGSAGVAGAEPAVVATVELDESSVSIDLRESGPAVSSALNASLTTTHAAIATAVSAALGPEVPVNGGLLRLIDLRTTAGTVVDADFPSAVSCGHVYLTALIVELVGAALAELTKAGTGAPARERSIVVITPEKAGEPPPVDLAPFAIAGCAGAEGRDGWGAPHVFSRSLLPSAEEWEGQMAIVVRGMELRCDSAGPGRWRGAPGLTVELGLRGGSQVTSLLFGDEMTLEDPPADRCPEGAGAGRERRLRLLYQGGSGYGDPQDRDRAAVLADVRDGLVSIERAKSAYGLQDEEVRP